MNARPPCLLLIAVFARLAVAAGPDAFVVTPEWAAANGHVPVHPYDSWATAATNINDCVDLGAWRNAAYVTIHVAPGHYHLSETITNIVQKPFFLRSDNGFPNGIGDTDRDGTVLDGMGGRRILLADHYSGDPENWWQSWIKVQGFTLTNGYAASGAGGAVNMTGSHTNSASVKQGFVEPSCLVDCRLAGNVAKTGNGGAVKTRSLVLRDCELVGNTALSGSGGAVYFETLKVTAGRFSPADLGHAPGLAGCVLSNNVCKMQGGAVFSYGSIAGGAAVVSDSRFENNRATSSDNGGTAIAFSGPSGFESVDCGGGVYGCAFKGESNSSARRGLLYCRGGNITVDGCVFRDVGLLDGRGIVYSENAKTLVSNSRFLDCNGPALHGVGTLRQCLVAGGYGDGVRLVGESSVEACTIVGRLAQGSRVKVAPAILVPPMKLVGSTDVDIAAAVSVSVTNCVFWGNATIGLLDHTDGGLARFALGRSCMEGWTAADGGEGMTAADPRFADAANGDYAPRWNSPCVDTGAVLAWMDGATTDLAGNPRVKFQAPDMGAFESQAAPPSTVMCFR